MDALRMPGRLLIGNLDCEESFRGGRRRPLSAAAAAAAAGAATLLRVFARDDDRLWLPAPIADEWLGPPPGAPLSLPRPHLESGPLGGLAGADEVLAWGETEEVAALRPAGRRPPATGVEGPLAEVLWRLPPPSPGVAARVAHRGFALGLAEELGVALPGSRLATAPREIAASERPWVAKAPYSAAGRDRLVHPGGALDPRAERTLERLFERHGALLLEPWCDRLEDFGAAALLDAAGTVRPVGFHRQLLTPKGRFRGVETGARPLAPPGLAPAERDRLLETLAATGAALAAAGYRGPYGIDAWRHRRPDGTAAFHPLGEINPRMTFGLVAHALAERAGGPLRLGLGGDPPPGAVALLRPSGRTAGSWITLMAK